MSLVTITPSYNYNQTCISNTAPNDEGFRMSNTSFVSDSGNYLTESFRVNKDCLICPRISFVPENKWLEASYCQICSIVFDKFKADFRHHCRICGASVCGLCSKKKINEKRTCDLCFLRIESKELIERREKVLALKDETIKDLEITIKVTRDKLNKIFDDLQTQKSLNQITTKQQKEQLEASQKELNLFKDSCQKNRDSQKKVRENLVKIVEIKNKKTEEFDKSLKNNKDKALENEKKLIDKQMKVQDLETLISQISKTKNTRSYADIFEFLEINNEDVMNFCIENNSQAESLDDLSSFVHKMRKSLAKASGKKSLMMKHSLLKGSMDKFKMKRREKKLGSQHGICCGNNDCSIF